METLMAMTVATLEMEMQLLQKFLRTTEMKVETLEMRVETLVRVMILKIPEINQVKRVIQRIGSQLMMVIGLI